MWGNGCTRYFLTQLWLSLRISLRNACKLLPVISVGNSTKNIDTNVLFGVMYSSGLETVGAGVGGGGYQWHFAMTLAGCPHPLFIFAGIFASGFPTSLQEGWWYKTTIKSA